MHVKAGTHSLTLARNLLLMAEAPAMHAVLSQTWQLVTCINTGTTETCI